MINASSIYPNQYVKKMNSQSNELEKNHDFAKFIVVNQDKDILLYNCQNYYRLFTCRLNNRDNIFTSVNSIGSWLKYPIMNVSRIGGIKFSCTRISKLQGSLYLIRILVDQKKKKRDLLNSYGLTKIMKSLKICQ